MNEPAISELTVLCLLKATLRSYRSDLAPVVAKTHLVLVEPAVGVSLHGHSQAEEEPEGAGWLISAPFPLK